MGWNEREPRRVCSHCNVRFPVVICTVCKCQELMNAWWCGITVGCSLCRSNLMTEAGALCVRSGKTSWKWTDQAN